MKQGYSPMTVHLPGLCNSLLSIFGTKKNYQIKTNFKNTGKQREIRSFMLQKVLNSFKQDIILFSVYLSDRASAQEAIGFELDLDYTEHDIP